MNSDVRDRSKYYWATQIIAIDYFGNEKYYFFCVICQKKSSAFKIETVLKRILKHMESEKHRDEIVRQGIGIMEMRNR